jgi:hypothetical protein
MQNSEKLKSLLTKIDVRARPIRQLREENEKDIDKIKKLES